MSKAADDAAKKTKGKSSKKKASSQSSSASSQPKPERDDGRQPDGKFTKDVPTAWKPGQSGNPAGRPKYRTLSEAIRAKLREKAAAGDTTYADAIAQCLVEIASGEFVGMMGVSAAIVSAVKEIGDRTEGKARQVIEIDPVANAQNTLANLLGRPVEELPAPRKEQ